MNAPTNILLEQEKPNPDDIFKSVSQSEFDSRQPEILLALRRIYGGEIAHRFGTTRLKMPGSPNTGSVKAFMKKHGFFLYNEEPNTLSWRRNVEGSSQTEFVVYNLFEKEFGWFELRTSL